jgi:hypothetical protein
VTPYGIRDDLKARIREFRTAFPDLHVAIVEVVTEGELVVARIELTGTHLGEFDGIPPPAGMPPGPGSRCCGSNAATLLPAGSRPTR